MLSKVQTAPMTEHQRIQLEAMCCDAFAQGCNAWAVRILNIVHKAGRGKK